MSTKEDLISIAIENFDLVNEFFEKKGRSGATNPTVPLKTTRTCLYQYQPEQAHVHQVKPAERMTNSYQVTRFGNGASVVDYSKRKSAAY